MGESAFFISGHGYEDIHAKRETLPEGVTLIVRTECGRAVTILELEEIANELTKTGSGDPTLLPPEIQEKLRIYKPGMEYPTLEVSLLADFPKPDNTIAILKSGVYPIPFPFDSSNPDDPMLISYGKTLYGMYVGHKIIDKTYEGSLMTPVDIEELKKMYGKHLPLQMLQKQTPITQIFNKLGPGIYYFTVCRQTIVFPSITQELFANAPESVNLMNSVSRAEYVINKLDNSDPLKQQLEKALEKTKKTRSQSRGRYNQGITKVVKRGGRRTRRRKVKHRTEK